MSSRRVSLGASLLRDVSNNRGSRRTSIGGGGHQSETPQKDRRGALEEWRRNSRQREPSTNDDTENLRSDTKRARTRRESYAGHGGPSPSLPPSTASSQAFVETGTTALERYRLKKQLKVQQEQQSQLPPRTSTIDIGATTPVRSSTGGGLNLSEDHGDDEISFHTGVHTSTPSSRRRLASSRARRRSFVPRPDHHSEDDQSDKPTIDQDCRSSSYQSDTPKRARRRSFVPPRPESEQPHHTLSQLSTDSDQNSSVQQVETSVEAGLRSRLREMEHRIEQLETEKTRLLVAKAPLEARLEQKEEEWFGREKKILCEIDSLKQSLRDAENRFHDVQASNEALEAENKRLRLEAKKPCNPTSSRGGGVTETNRWDRMLQSEDEGAESRKQLRSAQGEIEYLRSEKVSLEKELHGMKIENKALSRELDELQSEYDSLVESSSENRDDKIKLEHLTTEHIATSAQLNAVCQELADSKARSDADAKAKEEEYKSTLEGLRFQLSVATTRATTVVGGSEDGNDDVAVLQARHEEDLRRIAELEAEALRSEEIRRQMHNKLQELRGNIRVFVRTRPFLPGDGAQNEPAIDVSPDGETLTIQDIRTSKSHNFGFDKVFPPSAGQDQVFKEVADFVQSALDGYHVCLFSYGQTGSGKTHTMQGSGNSAMRGIIPRAVEQILNQARILQGQKWDFKLCASFLEIYNEELKDLLVGNSQKTQGKLSIKRSRGGKSYVDGLSESEIDTTNTDIGMEQLSEIMAEAARSRSVASTKMNAQSSRSHSVFMLRLRGSNEETGAEVHGALNLCDLAGSERLDRSEVGSDAQRLRETQAINKSLSCLGDVFNALAQGAAHVPYRNSKLTYLLQDCLSGDGKALMFVNLSPTTTSSNESLCSLRFAQRVNQVELGKPTKHIQYKKH